MQIEECRAALEYLLAYVEDPESHHVELDLAVRHVRGCPVCESRLGHFARALIEDEEDRLTCEECQDLLPEYLQAEAEARTQEELWHPVAYHLETCPHCSAAYTALSDLIELAYGEQGEEPLYYPVPDLSFVSKKKERPAETISAPWHLDELGRLIIRFSADFLRTLQPPALQPAYGMARVKAGEPPRVLWQFNLRVEDLDVTIIAEEKQGDPTHCRVMVQVSIPSRGGWPHLIDTEVTLKRDEQTLQTQLTDAFGNVVFKGIDVDDVAHLVFEVAPVT
jgi:uncharacterized protein YbaR (Trm112 family)